VLPKTNIPTAIIYERWVRGKQFLGRYISKILTWEPNNKDVLYFCSTYISKLVAWFIREHVVDFPKFSFYHLCRDF
jgi:hypothetical protein